MDKGYTQTVIQKKWALVLMLLIVSIVTHANEVLSAIKGKVLTSDGQPAASVTVLIKNTNRATITDNNGAFIFKKMQPGNYTIEVSLIGYENLEQTVTVEEDRISTLTFNLAATENQLEQVIVAGRKNKYKADKVSNTLRLQTPVINIPQNIQVVSADIMADQQAYDLVDGITRNVSGASRVGHWDNQYAQIRMRGSKIPAFRNGMNIEASWGPTAEDAAMIERVEFVKGPAGFMLANGEPGGFYNVVTKKPTGLTKGSANFSMGSFSTYRAAFDFDGKLSKDGKLLYRLNLAGQQKDYYTKYNYSNRYLITPVLKYLVDDRTSITFEYAYQTSKYLANGNYAFSKKGLADKDIANDFFYADPSLEPGKLKDHSVYLYFDHKMNNHWDMHAQVAYFNFSMVANSVWASRVYENGNMDRYMSIGDEAGENRFAQLSFSGEEFTGTVRHRILGGVDMGNKKFWGDFRTLNPNLRLAGVQFNVYNPTYGIPMDSIPKIDRTQSVRVRAGSTTYATSVNYMSGYVQDELGFFNDLARLSLGLRFTTAETTGKTKKASLKDNVWSPRVGLSISPAKDLSVYALYDQSFVPQSGTDYFGNAFVPVRGNDLEVGVKKDWFNGRWSTTVSAYKIIRENVLTSDPDPTHMIGTTIAQVQQGESQTKGIEVDVNGEILPGLNVTLNYALTDSKITKEILNPTVTNPVKTVGNVTGNTNKHITNGWLQYRVQSGLLQGFGVSSGFQWLADRYVGTTKVANVPNFFRLDAGLSLQRGKYSVNALMNNVLDDRALITAASLDTKAATDPTGFYSYIVEARRNFRITVGYRF